MNSWDKSDSKFEDVFEDTVNIADYWSKSFTAGENDLRLMKNLSKAGSDHGKFLRYINVTVDITAPLYWWKEFDTYKVGTVANSCSTMHKIHAKEFTLDDFSHDHLVRPSLSMLGKVIKQLNDWRDLYLHGDEIDPVICEKPQTILEAYKMTKKDVWWQMIQLLPSSYNQKRTVQLNYQVLKTMYFARRNHKLDEWHTLCEWMESLPYFREICIVQE